MAIGVKLYEYVGKSSLTNTIASRHTKRKDLLHWEKGTKERPLGRSRAMRYSPNQQSIYMDEQQGDILTAELVFENGDFKAPFNRPTLIEFMDKHPDNVANGGKLFREHDPAAKSKALKIQLDLEVDALITAREMTDPEKKSYLRNYLPSRVDKMNKDEIEIEVLKRAKADPSKFIDVNNDPEVDRRNTISEAFARGILTWKNGNSQVAWSHGTRNSNICRIPEGEDADVAFERYLMSNDGKEVFVELEIILEE